MCKYGIKNGNNSFGMRAAIAKRFSGDAALELFRFFRISVEFGAGRVLVRGAQRPRSYQDCDIFLWTLKPVNVKINI